MNPPFFSTKGKDALEIFNSFKWRGGAVGSELITTTYFSIVWGWKCVSMCYSVNLMVLWFNFIVKKKKIISPENPEFPAVSHNFCNFLSFNSGGISLSVTSLVTAGTCMTSCKLYLFTMSETKDRIWLFAKICKMKYKDMQKK